MVMNSEQLWQSVIGELELSLSKANFTTWFKGTRIIALEGDKVCVGVPNSFTESWLRKKYHSLILKSLKKHTNNLIKDVDFKVENSKSNYSIQIPFENRDVNENVQQKLKNLTPPPPLTVVYQPKIPTIQPQKNNHVISSVNNIPQQIPAPSSSFSLNPRYTFDNFVVGKGNELAFAASKAVAERPGILYNPLFVYGGVGLGKTHLIQAVGNAIAKENPDFRIIYITTEKFTNDFIQALKTGQMEKFKAMYRNIDILLVDDVQFMAGKDQTQEEFFHTFNALYQNNKQIILNSDRPPKAIPSLEQRLVSRFAAGMIADISQPDLETRIAILEMKVKEKETSIPIEILRYLADNIQSSVRELEGALNKIIALHQLSGTVPDMETAQRVVSTAVAASYKGGMTAKQIISIVAAYFGITPHELAGLSRKKDLVIPRQIAMYLIRQELKSSFPSIGDELGGRDHTTAMHACNKVSELLKTDIKLKADVENILSQLKQK